MKQDISDLRVELKEDIGELRADVQRLDGRVDELNVRLVAVEVHTGVAARLAAQDKLSTEEDAQ